MKKVFVLAVIAIFVMIPFSTFAKTAMSDNDMASVTAQAFFTVTSTSNLQLMQLAKYMGYSTSTANRNKFLVALINILHLKKVSSNSTTLGSGINNGGTAGISYMRGLGAISTVSGGFMITAH